MHASGESLAGAMRLERRRRQQHFRRLRRDLLEDVAIAILLTALLLTFAAGLGVVVLLEIPLAGALIGSALARRVRLRRLGSRAGAAQRPGPVRATIVKKSRL